MVSVHSKEASKFRAPYMTAKHGLLGLVRAIAKEGGLYGLHCPGFIHTPFVDKQIPEQARELGIAKAEFIRNVMLNDTVDGEFTSVEDVAPASLFFAAFPNKALTGQSLLVTHDWFMD